MPVDRQLGPRNTPCDAAEGLDGADALGFPAQGIDAPAGLDDITGLFHPPVSFPLNGGTLQAEPDSALPAMAASARRFDRISKSR